MLIMVLVQLIAYCTALHNPRPSDLVVYIDHYFPPFQLPMLFLMCYIYVLFDLLIMDIRRRDGVNNGLSNGLSQLESFLNDCHIPFKFSVSKETKNCNGMI